MAQAKTIQLLRSQAVSANLEAAKQVLLGVNGTGAKTAKDGEIVLVRYYANNDQTTIKSILGIYHKDQPLEDGSINGWTILEDVASSVEGLEHLQNVVNAIETSTGLKSDGTKDNFSGDDVLQVVEANDSLLSAISKIADRIGKMDKAASAVDGQVVTTVSEANGVVSETKANLTDIVMAGYAADTTKTGAIAATDTLELAFNKVENAITNTTVKSSDKTVKITDKSGKDLSVNIDGATLVKDATDGTISSALKVIKVIPTGTAGTDEVVDDTLATNVKEAYRLVYNGNTAAIGQQVNVYKESALDRVYMGHVDDTVNSSTGVVTSGKGDDAMCFIYHQADGTYTIVSVNVESFLQEAEFGDGLQVANHVVTVKTGDGLEYGSESGTNKSVKVKIDGTSETFLTVGANGVKLSGVQNAIDSAKATINAYTVNGKAISTSPVLDGSNINVDDTAATKETVKAAITRLDAAAAGAKTVVAEGTDAGNNMTIEKTTDTTTQADTYTISLTGIAQDSEVVKSVNTKTPTNGAVTVGGGDIALTGYSKGSSADPVAAADTVNAAIGKLENQIDAAKAAATAVKHANGNTHVTVTSSTDTTTGKVTYTVNETNIADADDLTAEIAARKAVDGQSGDTYAANSSANYISGATSLNNADVLLDTALKAADDAMLTKINGSNAIEVSTKSNKQQTVSLKLDTTATTGNITSDMLEINSNGLMMKDTWDCGVF